MEKKIVYALIVSGVAVLAAGTSVQAYGKKDKQAEAPVVQPAAEAPTAPAVEGTQPPAMDPQMEAWMKASTPSDNHKNLEIFNGNFTYTMKWWKGPEATPEESSGMTNGQWILGGHFIQQNVSGTAMGQPFEGISITGYDNVKGEYSTVWIDNMSTGMMTSHSQFDAATKSFSETGSFACPMTGKKDMTFRGAIQITDNDNYTYQMYSADETEKEFKMMEITYARVQ